MNVNTTTAEPLVVTDGAPDDLTIDDDTLTVEQIAELPDVQQVVVVRDPSRPAGLHSGTVEGWRRVAVLRVPDQATADRLLVGLANDGGVLVPRPLLGCPSWCDRTPGHGWDDILYGEGEGGALVVERTHEGRVLAEPWARVELHRTDRWEVAQQPQERVLYGSRVLVTDIGLDGQGYLHDPAHIEHLGAAVSEASRLLAQGREHGDPLPGPGNEGPRLGERVVVDERVPSGYVAVSDVGGRPVAVVSGRDSRPTHARLLRAAGWEPGEDGWGPARQE
ncbi:hypothetical protein [Aquipuribacter sp. SD81]|uniref:hypothetical protein n=1 Tax=Aquipuribacter sp. SD81 TaxID=3127703 RepID=UPI003017EAA2